AAMVFTKVRRDDRCDIVVYRVRPPDATTETGSRDGEHVSGTRRNRADSWREIVPRQTSARSETESSRRLARSPRAIREPAEYRRCTTTRSHTSGAGRWRTVPSR